jgi:DNA-binding NtrC family response regulator
MAYHWPGNIRELRNAVERAMITATGPTLTISVPRTSGPATGEGRRLEDVERTYIIAVLNQTGWRIRGEHGAAGILGLPPTTLENRMKKLGITRPRSGSGPART